MLLFVVTHDTSQLTKKLYCRYYLSAHVMILSFSLEQEFTTQLQL